MTSTPFSQLSMLALEKDWYTKYMDLPAEEKNKFLQRPCTYGHCVCKGKGSLRFGITSGANRIPYSWLHVMKNPLTGDDMVNALTPHPTSPLVTLEGKIVKSPKSDSPVARKEYHRKCAHDLLSDPDEPGYFINYRGYATAYSPVNSAFKRTLTRTRKRKTDALDDYHRRKKKKLDKLIDKALTKREKKRKSQGWDIKPVPTEDAKEWQVSLHAGRYAFYSTYFVAHDMFSGGDVTNRVFVELEVSMHVSRDISSIVRTFKRVAGGDGTDLYIGIELFKKRAQVPSERAQMSIVRAGVTQAMATF